MNFTNNIWEFITELMIQVQKLFFSPLHLETMAVTQCPKTGNMLKFKHWQ